MSFIRVFFTFLIIFFVFIGNIGMNVFIHSCEEDGVFQSFMVKVDHDCGHEEKSKPSCCDKEKASGDCCNDEVKVFQVKFDFFHSSDFQVPEISFLTDKPIFAFYDIQNEESNEPVKYSTRPPPKPSGQHILLLNQVFRI